MTFTPFSHKEKNFAIIDLIGETEITLKGREGEMIVDKKDIKNPEIGETVYLETNEAVVSWKLKVEDKVVKSSKGYPRLTATQEHHFISGAA